MATQTQSESLVVKFLDNFLQEKNIKWVLATGTVILLGSSLMMVMPHWDAFDPIWKFLIIVGYTGAIFLTGWGSYHKFVLRKTGTTLLALSVLMIPVSFMSWQLTWAAANSIPSQLVAVILLGLNLVLAESMSRSTFQHFLRGHQPTFVTSYMVLSLAGAIAPDIRQAGDVWSWVASFVLWGVFSVGAVKVNRHVFWLTEEYQRPRIFGFFPILLLGGQFLFLFAAHFAGAVPVEWLGFGCVLVAIPVLLTADSVAGVFQKRTGDLVRPIPWPILLPLLFGLTLCAVGVVVAGTSIAQRLPYALVPTAGLAACLLGLVARRTNRTPFVWAMLAGVVLAYNFSPVFFQEFARGVVSQGAAAVQEARLPYAFYGLTYLPLIVITSGVAAFARQRGNEFFARPMRQFSVAISWVLLAASVGHVKALLPVATVMVVVFSAQAWLFRRCRSALAATIALLVAAAGIAPYADRVIGLQIPTTMYFLIPLGAAFLLRALSFYCDDRIAQLSLEDVSNPGDSPLTKSMCRTMSIVGNGLVAGAWLAGSLVVGVNSSPFAGLLIGASLLVQSLMNRHLSGVGEKSVAFAAARGPVSPFAAHFELTQFGLAISNWTILVALAQCLVPNVSHLPDLLQANLALLVLGTLSAVSLLLWIPTIRSDVAASEFASAHRVALRFVCGGTVVLLMRAATLSPIESLLSACLFAALIAGELWTACRNQNSARVWTAEFIAALAACYFVWFRVITFGHGWSMFVVLGCGVTLHVAGTLASRRPATLVLARPFLNTGLWMPLVTVAIGVGRHILHFDHILWHGMNSLAILLAGAFYFWQAVEQRSKHFAVLSAAILNIAVMLLWRELEFRDPQFYLIPIGISILALVRILEREIPTAWHNPLRYAGALTILVSPTFHIVSGSWLHLFTLMLASTTILLVSIGLRVRPLMYTGAAFLVADLIGMVVCGGVDHPNILWIAGIGFGGAVVALGAYCEHHREKLLQRMRAVSAQLEHWR